MAEQESTIDWLGLVTEADKEHYEVEVAYRFSNDREFKSTDKTGGGPYES